MPFQFRERERERENRKASSCQLSFLDESRGCQGKLLGKCGVCGIRIEVPFPIQSFTASPPPQDPLEGCLFHPCAQIKSPTGVRCRLAALHGRTQFHVSRLRNSVHQPSEGGTGCGGKATHQAQQAPSRSEPTNSRLRRPARGNPGPRMPHRDRTI